MRTRLSLTPYALLTALLVVTFLLGGGSRHDIASLALLRPLACVAAALGVLTLTWPQTCGYRPLFALLASLALIIGLQLIPLPPSVWSTLEGRSIIHQLDSAVGLSGAWRPLTFSPMKTANALASLVVPLAALVLFIQLDARQRERILLIIVAIAVSSALLGVLQQLSGASSALYFYEITNRGSAVGLFANRNHHAVFLCCALLVVLYLAHTSALAARRGRLIVLFTAAAVLFVAILANASRAGLICLGAALAIAAVGLFVHSRARGTRQSLSLRLVSYASLLVPAAAIFGMFAAAGRSPALARFFDDSELTEYRARVLPDLLEMASAFQPWGTGFGAFEYAFRTQERVELLGPAYLNNAHNDWLQWVIEGGVPGLLVMLGAIVLIALRLVALMRTRRATEVHAISVAWLGFAVLMVLAIASTVDYPLRVPSIMAFAIIAAGLVCRPDLRGTCDARQSQ